MRYVYYLERKSFYNDELNVNRMVANLGEEPLLFRSKACALLAMKNIRKQTGVYDSCIISGEFDEYKEIYKKALDMFETTNTVNGMKTVYAVYKVMPI